MWNRSGDGKLFVCFNTWQLRQYGMKNDGVPIASLDSLTKLESYSNNQIYLLVPEFIRGTERKFHIDRLRHDVFTKKDVTQLQGPRISRELAWEDAPPLKLVTRLKSLRDTGQIEDQEAVALFQ